MTERQDKISRLRAGKCVWVGRVQVSPDGRIWISFGEWVSPDGAQDVIDDLNTAIGMVAELRGEQC